MAKREVSKMRITVRRLCGQVCTGPSAVRDHSVARMRAPVSPPPAKISPRSRTSSSNEESVWLTRLNGITLKLKKVCAPAKSRRRQAYLKRKSDAECLSLVVWLDLRYTDLTVNT